MNLPENIKRCRRELNMTQEQLAEAVGVTVGAVSKWESGATTPDLALLLSLADLFQTSLDALLGFELRGAGAMEQVDAIKECIGNREFERGRVKAEKALRNFPNHFEVVYRSALFFELLALDREDREAACEAIELYRRAMGLLDQNRDREISARTIQVRISQCYMYLKEYQQALDTLRDSNEDGVNNDLMGMVLMHMERWDEAMQVLSESLLDSHGRIFRAVTGMVNCLDNGKDTDHAAALELQNWLVGFQESLYSGEACFLHKSTAALLVGCAAIAANMGDEAACEGYLRRAKETAAVFDAAPCYRADRMRFYRGRSATAHDDFGRTAREGILRTIGMQDEKTGAMLTALWEKLS